DACAQMSVIDTKRIIDFLEHRYFLSNNIHRHPRNRTRQKSHHNCPPSGDNTSCRSNGDKTGNHALYCANNGRFFEEEDIQDGPGEETHGSAYVGVENRSTCIRTCSVWITSI